MKYDFVKKGCSILLALLLSFASCGAFADTGVIEVNGSVINIQETPVTTSYTGMIDQIYVREGSYVRKGDIIAALKTTPVYATEDGTVRLFGNVGDSASMITSHYGAVAYIEPEVKFTISASTRYAYDSEETKTIHPGESVYLRGNSTLTHVGTGIVTQVCDTSFTVDVKDSNFDSGESVNVYRDAGYTNAQRIGRGSVSRSEYAAYEGSGIIVSYQVTDGSTVKKGDVLFETIEGVFAGYGTDLTEIKAEEDGVITSLTVSLGSSVTAGDTICKLYPDDTMRVEVSVNEENLAYMTVGSAVSVHFTYLNEGEYTVSGMVEEVSGAGSTDESGESEESIYNAIIRLDDITNVSYGMTVTVVK